MVLNLAIVDLTVTAAVAVFVKVLWLDDDTIEEKTRDDSFRNEALGPQTTETILELQWETREHRGTTLATTDHSDYANPLVSVTGKCIPECSSFIGFILFDFVLYRALL